MNLIEAIKSGKAFRQANSLHWYHPEVSKEYWSTAGVLADNWEVEEDSITITRSQFVDGVTSCMIHVMTDSRVSPYATPSLMELAGKAALYYWTSTMEKKK